MLRSTPPTQPENPVFSTFSAEILRRGYSPEFVEEYRDELIRLIDRFSSNDPTVWEEVENLHDEYSYFQFFDTVVIET